MIRGQPSRGWEGRSAVRLRTASSIAYLIVAILAGPRAAGAQFISPGKLTRAHDHLTGLRNCTQCHQLRNPGAAPDRCLECHVPLRTRLKEKRGLHAAIEEEYCGECHKEHFGIDFDMVRFDTATFEHDVKTGYELVEAHAEAECRSCHKVDYIEAADVKDFKGEHGALDRTFLGLATTCIGCHAPEDPHEKQFPDRSCDECHAVTTWEEAELHDHDKTRFRLTGKHRKVDCKECHKPIRNARREEYAQYIDMKFDSCENCHDDVHEGELGQDCKSCHVTADWHRIEESTFEETFDHATIEFKLVGKHQEAECSACHGKPPKRDEEVWVTLVDTTLNFTYPHPEREDCVSCHRDYHRAVFEESAGGIVCDNCHTEHGWLPADYNTDRHNDDSEFKLEGAHLATPCNLCHVEPEEGLEAAQFDIPEQQCVSCHEKDYPHEEQYRDEPCEDCHNSESYLIPDYDHSETEFPLDGEHQDVPCASCHPEEVSAAGDTFVRYKPVDSECRDCHGGG